MEDHKHVVLQTGREPSRLVDVWFRKGPPEPGVSITSLVVTAFDLYRSLFGDCVFSLFSGKNPRIRRSLNDFQLPDSQYRELTRGLKRFLTLRKCSVREAFREVTPGGLQLLSAIAYDLTVSRVWVVRRRSLDPVHIPFRPTANREERMYSQILLSYVIKDVVGIVLMHLIDPCLVNHLRCSKATREGIRCNKSRAFPSISCLDHKTNPTLLSNHYLG